MTPILSDVFEIWKKIECELYLIVHFHHWNMLVLCKIVVFSTLMNKVITNARHILPNRVTSVVLADPLQRICFTISCTVPFLCWFIRCCVRTNWLERTKKKESLLKHTDTHFFYYLSKGPFDTCCCCNYRRGKKRWISYICWDGLWFLIYRLRGQLSSRVV